MVSVKADGDWLRRLGCYLLLFPTVAMELCKQTKTHTSAASAHSSQTSQPRVSNTRLFLEQDRGQDTSV